MDSSSPTPKMFRKVSMIIQCSLFVFCAGTGLATSSGHDFESLDESKTLGFEDSTVYISDILKKIQQDLEQLENAQQEKQALPERLEKRVQNWLSVLNKLATSISQADSDQFAELRDKLEKFGASLKKTQLPEVSNGKKSPEYLFHFGQKDRLYKVMQWNLGVAKNLRDCVEKGRPQRGVNYSYWVFKEEPRGSHFSEVKPPFKGMALDCNAQLKGVLHELGARSQELQSHPNVSKRDSALISSVVNKVDSEVEQGMKRVEEAIRRTGIQVPSRPLTAEQIAKTIEEFHDKKLEPVPSDFKDFFEKKMFANPDDGVDQWTFNHRDLPKLHKADQHFAKLVEVLPQIESIEQKLKSSPRNSSLSKRLAKDLEAKRSEFLRLYSDFANLKDYYSTNVITGLPQFEARFRRVTHGGYRNEQKDSKPIRDVLNEHLNSSDNETQGDIDSKEKPSARDLAKREIDDFRSRIIQQINDKKNLGKSAESQFQTALEHLKTLEEALDKSKGEDSPGVAQDHDSRWLASLDSPTTSVEPSQIRSVEKPTPTPVSSNPEPGNNPPAKELGKPNLDSRDAKRDYVDSLARPTFAGEDRVSSLGVSEGAKPKDTFETPRGSSAVPPASRSEVVSDLSPNGAGVDSSLSENSLERRKRFQNEPGAKDYEENKPDGKKEEPASQAANTVLAKAYDDLKQFMTGFYSTTRTNSTSVATGSKSQDPQKSTEQSAGVKDSNSSEGNALPGDLRPGGDDYESGYSLRRSQGNRAAKSLKNQNGNTTISVALGIPVTPNPPVSTVNKNENLEKPINDVATKYIRNPDGTWSPISLKKRSGAKDSDKQDVEVGLALGSDDAQRQLGKISEEIKSEQLMGLDDSNLVEVPAENGEDSKSPKTTLDSITQFLQGVYSGFGTSKMGDISKLLASTLSPKEVKRRENIQHYNPGRGAIRGGLVLRENEQVREVASEKLSLLDRLKGWLGID